MTSNRTPKKVPGRPATIDEKKLGFLAVLAECCQVGKACRALKISRSAAYQWRSEDEQFRAAWDRAMKVGLTALEDEAHRRAFDGTLKPIYQGGVKCGTVREYSDTLAIFLLKSHDPEKYRDRKEVRMDARVDVAEAIAQARKRVK